MRCNMYLLGLKVFLRADDQVSLTLVSAVALRNNCVFMILYTFSGWVKFSVIINIRKNSKCLSSNIWWKIFYCGLQGSGEPFFTSKEQLRDSCKRKRNIVKSSVVFNVKNKIETKGLAQFNRPFLIKKPNFNRWIHHVNSASFFYTCDGKLQAHYN